MGKGFITHRSLLQSQPRNDEQRGLADAAVASPFVYPEFTQESARSGFGAAYRIEAFT
jgi:hypothetical protein